MGKISDFLTSNDAGAKIKHFFVCAVTSLVMINCGGNLDPSQTQSSSDLQNHWEDTDAPERMGLSSNEYETRFNKLPESASLSQIPWSGGYLPSYRGGATYRSFHHSQSEKDRIYYDTLPFEKLSKTDVSQLSALEKYAIYTNDPTYSLLKEERERTDVFSQLRGHTIEYWSGLCHAWAPATLMYPNPGPTTLTGSNNIKVKFGSSDIKTLLTLYLHHTSSPDYFVSRRCNTDDKALRYKLDRGQISMADYKAAMETAECQGVHPGAFHIILGNMIGIKDTGFIADLTRGREVWNQPVSGYKSRVLEEKAGHISAQAAPGTAKEVLVETIMVYTVEITDTWDRVQIPQSNRTISYKYWLELDRNDRIIGGMWESEERPDFIWRREKPSPEFEGIWAPLGEIMKTATADVVAGEQSSRKKKHSAGEHHNDGETRLHTPTSLAATNANNSYMLSKPRWKVSKFMFTYIVDLKIEAAESVDKIVLETVKNNGQVHRQHSLKKKHGVFRLKNLPIAQWKAGTMNVIGYGRNGQKLFSFSKDFS